MCYAAVFFLAHPSVVVCNNIKVEMGLGTIEAQCFIDISLYDFFSVHCNAMV